MKRLLSALSLTCLWACQPANTMIPFPSAEPTSTPSPTAVPQETPLPVATPTPPGTEPIISLTEAQVTAKRESRVIERALTSPNGQRTVYSYRRELEADLKGWFYNPAHRSLESGLWLSDNVNGKQSEPEGLKGIIAGTPMFWSDAEALVWADSEGLQRLNLTTGIRSTLFSGANLSQLSQREGLLFFMNRSGASGQIVRLNPSTGETLVKPLPYQDVYNFAVSLYALSADTVVLGEAKQANQSGTYPFQVSISATPAPPRIDTYLLSLTTNQAEPLSGGLDLGQAQQVSLAPDQTHYLVQQDSQTLIYDRSGAKTAQFDGHSIWLDAQHLLSLEALGLVVRNPDGEILSQLSTQNRCTRAQQAPQGLLLQCDVRIRAQDATRVYLLSDPLGTASLKELPLSLGENDRAELDEAGQILVQVPGAAGYSALYQLNAEQVQQQLFRLINPTTPSFSFDPIQDAWYGH